MRKRLAAVILAVVVAAVFTLPEGAVFAADKTEDLDARAVMGSSMATDDGSRSGGKGFMSRGWSKTDKGTFRNGAGGKVLKGAIQKGVDISKHNGKINWAKVAKSDIDYVIIRCGYGSNKKKYDDKRWEYNVSQCEKYGIPYGVYIYSYAISTKRVNSEIAHTKRLLKGHHPQYPVYYDLEDRIVRKKGKTFITNAALKFCSEIEKAGYTSGCYASRSWWNSYMTTSKLNKYEKWIAEWNSTGTIYKKAYGMWQCSSRYHTPGIDGRVDLDFSYKQYKGNTPGIWSKDEDGRTIFRTFKAKSGGRYDTSASLMATSRFITRVGKTYYLYKNGHKFAGFHDIGKYRYHFSSSGVMKKSQFFKISGKTYYADGSGHLAINKYRKIGNYYYGFNKDGVMLKGDAVIGDKCYHFISNGMAYLNTSKVKTKAPFKSSPGAKFKTKGTYKKGTIVHVIRVYRSWSKLSNGKWIMTKYLTRIKKYPYDAPKPEPEDPGDDTDDDPSDDTDDDPSVTPGGPGVTPGGSGVTPVVTPDEDSTGGTTENSSSENSSAPPADDSSQTGGSSGQDGTESLGGNQ